MSIARIVNLYSVLRELSLRAVPGAQPSVFKNVIRHWIPRPRSKTQRGRLQPRGTTVRAVTRIVCIWLAGLVMASPAFAVPSQPLPVEQVFQLTAEKNKSHQVLATWQIAPGYYLYRDRLSFHLAPFKTKAVGCDQSIECLAHTLPPGKQITDADVGNYTVYEHSVSIPVQLPQDNKSQMIVVTYQGCSASGFCYPPLSKTLNCQDKKCVDIGEMDSASHTPADFFSSQQNRWFVLASFLGLGILLGFTPCVFPMIPILASIIIGHAHQLSRFKAFKLAFTYVMSMAVTYAAAGMVVAWLGSYVQADFQQPWILIAASIALVLLALSLFGLYELRLPSGLLKRLSHHSHRQQGGTYVGVAVMGCLATLIVSPCVSAPLVGALGYISATGDTYFGGSALFLLGLGMGLPLLIILTVGSRYLPKAGRWMNVIKALCGVLLLLVAISLLLRLVPGSFTWLSPAIQTQSALNFKPIKTPADLQKELQQAKQQNKPVLLDFYADWCIACKKMDKYTFTDPNVISVLKDMILLRANVTANDAEDKALQRYLNVVAPPTIVLFDAKGKELSNQRIVGEVTAEELLKKIN